MLLLAWAHQQQIQLSGGAPATLDTETLTVGTAFLGENAFGYVSGLFGSIDDLFFAPAEDAIIAGMYWLETSQTLQWGFLLADAADEGWWDTMTIDGVPYLRSNATFDNGGGTTANWTWTGITSSPFVAVAEDSTIVFT